MAQTDRAALIALYKATNGANWIVSINWNTDTALKDWYGVEVNGEDRVVGLRLESNNLRGTIPEELGKLTTLKTLDLHMNDLSGHIPPQLGDLGALEILNLAHNKFDGPIPPELGNLAALRYLDLDDNKLSGHIPPQLGDLSALKHLTFVHNKLDGFIPAQLGQLSDLEYLELSENELIGPIPEELGALSMLETLHLYNNRLTGPIPKELGALSKLKQLYLYRNRLTGTIPEELGKLAALEELALSVNSLSGHIPPELGALRKLEELDFRLNDLDGPIPPELGNLAVLRGFFLSCNQLSGPIPRELGALAKLEVLSLNSNQLTGLIPKELGALSKLRQLSLQSNGLTGIWNILGKEEAGSTVTQSGTLPVALASLLDSFDRLTRGYGLSLAQNPWEHPPEAVVTGGMRAVRQYFEAIFKGGTTDVTRPLKVVIVGKETIGKTSLRRSIKAGRPCVTKDDGAESTVHVDVEDHDVDGHPIRMFDCAGQAAYYGLLQLFLTPRAVYLLVWDAEKASQMDKLNLEDLGIAPWLRQMTFRVPSANVVLVGNKWDLVAEAHHLVAVEVERQSHQWLTAWKESAHGHQPPQLTLEAGVSRVSCAPSGQAGWAPSFGGRKAWPCDKIKPGERGLLRRIIYNPDDDTRAVTMRLPPGYVLALNWLEELSRSRNEAGQKTLVTTRAKLEEEWKIRVHALDTAGTTVAASEAAMSGAILIRKWEGGLVEYGDFIFLDVGWFAEVLDPLFSHKRDSNGIIDLGGKTVKNVESLKRLDTDHIFEPALAEDLWGVELTPHLLSALNSAGLTFPIPNDPGGGLVVVLRMDTEPPPDYRAKVEEEQTRERFDLRLKAQCSFSLGLPPGFVERLLARCCHLGFPHPFWRYGALVVGDGAEEGSFSLTLEYSEEDKTLKVEVNGRCDEVHAWATLSKVLSVTIKMLSEFPGLPCQPEFLCPRHESKGMRVSKANTQPGCRLVEEGHFCPICPDRTAGTDLLGVALQAVEFSDTEFSETELRKQFADYAERMAREGRALWPAPETEVPVPDHIISGHQVPAPNHISLGHQVPAPNPISSCCQVLKTLGHKDVETWIGTASAACLAVFGVFAGRDDDDPRLWGVFLGVGLLFLLVVLVQIVLRVSKLNSPSGAAGAENEHDVETPSP